MTKQFQTVKEVYEAVMEGKTVYWGNTAYKVYINRDDMPERTAQHKGRQFASINGHIVEVRCIENYFGSIITPECLPELFTK